MSDSKKVASGLVIYLLEELTDARLRVAQLKKYTKMATDLIEKSEHRDHFFEVAGHLIHDIPETVMKIDKALDAASLAAARLDYEEIKAGLRPAKVDELEDALQDVRMRYLNRRGESPVKSADWKVESSQKTALLEDGPIGDVLKGRWNDVHDLEYELEATLRSYNDAAHFGGSLAEHDAKDMIRKVQGALKELKHLSMDTFKGLVDSESDFVKKYGHPSDYADNMRRKTFPRAASWKVADEGCSAGSCNCSGTCPVAGAGEEFQKQNPKITDEEAKRIDEMHAKHKDVVKDKQAATTNASQIVRILRQAYSAGLASRENADDSEMELGSVLMDAEDSVRDLANSGPKPGPMGHMQNVAAGIWEIAFWLGASHAAKWGTKQASWKIAEEDDSKKDDDKEEKGKAFPGAAPPFGKKEDKSAAWKVRSTEEKDSRFEEGKPADPTQNMSEEDAKKWKDMNEEHGGKFKEASNWKVGSDSVDAGRSYTPVFIHDTVQKADGKKETRKNSWLPRWGRPSNSTLRGVVAKYEKEHPGETILEAEVRDQSGNVLAKYKA